MGTRGDSINLCIKSMHWVIRIKRGIPVKISLFSVSISNLFWGIKFHIGNLNVLSLVLVGDAVFVVLASSGHVLGDVLQQALVQVSGSVLFKREVLLVACTRQRRGQKVCHVKSIFIWLLEF